MDPTCDNAGCEHPPGPNAEALGKFIDYALKKPEVRFVTFSDLIRWMQVKGRCGWPLAVQGVPDVGECVGLCGAW